MSHTICRFKKLSSFKAIAAAEVHNARLYDELGYRIPDNIKVENQGFYGSNNYEMWLEGKDMADAIKRKLSSLDIIPRKDSVLAHEYVLGVSKDWYEKANYSASGMLSNLLGFIMEKYGSENIVSTSEHFDESTPHIHVIVLPIVKKERKWKNKNGQGIKKTYGLSGSDFVNGKDTLRQLQTDFYNYAKRWDQGDAVLRRGLLSEKQTIEYTDKTNHLLGELRDLTASMQAMIDAIRAGKDVEEHRSRLFEEEKKYNELLDSINKQRKSIATSERKTKYRKEKNKNGGWKKGLDF